MTILKVVYDAETSTGIQHYVRTMMKLGIAQVYGILPEQW